MEEQKDMLSLLDMMVQPVFCAKESKITKVNAAAQQLFLSVGDDVTSLLLTGAEEYAELTDGCLYLTLALGGQPTGASVRRMDGMDVFVLDSESDSSALRAMALAASELRKPLSGVLSDASALLESQEDPETRQQLAQLNRGLYRMLRLLGNMSDAEHFASHCRMETADVGSVLRDIFEKARTLVEHAGITLTYQDWQESIYCLLDRSQLERAVLNILSNAVRFTPKGGQIIAGLTRRGRTLRLTIQDSGSGIAEEVMGNLFQRYLRQPGIEDSRFGLGLGIKLIHTTALHHGGTLLIRQGDGGGTCVVLTMAIRQKEQPALRSPVLKVDYTGGFDHSLVELADCLPASLYDGTF